MYYGERWVKAAQLNGSKSSKGLAVDKLVFKSIQMPFILQIIKPLVWVVLGSKIITIGFFQMLINMAYVIYLKIVV